MDSAPERTIIVPSAYNYVAAFLTLRCPLRCSYCIAAVPSTRLQLAELSGKEWVAALNRLSLTDDLPVTLQGGEPTQHPDFYEIVNGLNPTLRLDLLTNLQFDVEEFMRRISPDRFRRPAPYASIRISYHPECMEGQTLIMRVKQLKNAGYSVGIWGVLHPLWQENVLKMKHQAEDQGIDFRTKEFLGVWNGKLYGTYADPEAVMGRKQRKCCCRTSELLIGPEGGVYRCHRDLYHASPHFGRITDPQFIVADVFRSCVWYGQCNPCDLKVKFDRFQRFGHCAVTIDLAADSCAHV